MSNKPDTPVTCPRCMLSFSPSGESTPLPVVGGTVSVAPPEPPAPSPSPSDEVPTSIARFAIRRFLGEGSFGRVYEADDPTLKRVVALKVAKAEQMGGPKRVQRFKREAQAAANLMHPNIVAVFDSGEEAGRHYIASAFVPGRPLDAVLEGDGERRAARPALELREIVEVVRKLADALAYAHKSGIIHRDIKPANVMLRDDGEPMLMDFGLAARLDETEKLTVAGQFMGTPEYCAPEQWRGEATPASDQYSLGCMLFEMLTSEKPFAGGSSEHYMMLHLTQPAPSPRKFRPDLPRDLENITLKCLEKEQARRYANCGALAEDLRRWLAGEPVSARKPSATERVVRWTRKNPLVATLSAAVLLVFALGATVATVFGVQATNALHAADQQRKQRAVAQIDSLCDSAPGAVPVILAALSQNNEDVLPQLRERHTQEQTPAKKTRLALALLDTEVDAVRDGLFEAMMKVEDPAEFVLIRDTLKPHASGLVVGLWKQIDNPDVRFRALAALAAFDAGNERWKTIAPTVVNDLLAINSVQLGTWVVALEPVSAALYEPLGVVFRDETPENATRRLAAAQALKLYLSSRPDAETLMGLLLDADGKQYALLRPLMEPYREQIVARMHAELAKMPDYWKDAPLDAKWKLDAKIQAEIANASGIVAERWAMCQSLPMDRLAAVTAAMGAAGYRPLSVRLYRSAGVPPATPGAGETPAPRAGETPALRTSVVWTRDGREWRLEQHLTLEVLPQRDAAQQKAGFVPSDVAAFTTADGVRYHAVWRRADKDEKAVLFADVPEEKMLADTTAKSADGLVPLRISSLNDDKGETRFSSVWITGKDAVANLSWTDDEGKHAGHVADADRLLLDVDLRQASPPRPAREFWLANLKQQRAAALKQPDSPNSLYFQGVALYNLGRDTEAIEAMEAYHAKSKAFFGHGHLALLHARVGKSDEARKALAAFAKIQSDPILLAVTTAQLEVYLGNADKTLADLDEQLKANEKDSAWLYAAARVYARAAETVRLRQQGAHAASLVGVPALALLPVAAKSEAADKYAERSLALLGQAIAAGYAEFATLQSDTDLEAIRMLPGYRALLAKAGQNRRYASVWAGDATKRAESLQGLNPETHLAKCRELASKGFRPVALSLASVAGEKTSLAASVWHRPIAATERATLARRQANAAATLLVLKQPEKAWPLFQHSPNPSSRSWLVWRAGEFGSDPRQLIARLDEEKDPSARRALILALGEYGEKELPTEVRTPVVKKLLGWYRDDADPGIHAAISWLLRHKNAGPEKRLLDWGQAQALDAIDKELAGKPARTVPPLAGSPPVSGSGAGWYVNTQGQTMVLVKGPVDFAMGSRLWDPDRFAGNDRPHIRRIHRSFAIGSTSVTVGQWERFLKDRPERRYAYPKRYSPEDGGPIISVDWYEAAEYCNWLSEKEGIPEEQWVYPKKIGPGMKLPANHLKRTGYRLPTEAEMDFACRAGSEESRYYGGEISLLPRHAHFLVNSKDRTHPVGQKRPNDLGLFDAHGNVWNWTQSPFIRYPQRQSAIIPLDMEYNSDILIGVDINIRRVLRGGSFFNHAAFVRSSQRNDIRPGVRSDGVGLRVCRTYTF